MLVLNDGQIRSLGFRWPELADRIERAVRVLDNGDFAQPIKPYLRYRDPRNRIIAMPAFLGGEFDMAGIKWIASFPGNLELGLPRAHGVIVLNRADTGQPTAILAGGAPNLLRTAAVSGLMLRRWLETRPEAAPLRIAIFGWGPIGRAHFDMCASLFGDRIGRFLLHDPRGVEAASIPQAWRDRTDIVPEWQEAYGGCNVCITCTVADRRYIDRPPADGALLLNVSLRDYRIEALRSLQAIVVDDWEEVCRENTDIELLHRENGLLPAGTASIADVVCRDALRGWDPAEPVLFCPMGMAVFDLAVAGYLAGLARQAGVGTEI
ncbi:2,3-diaminopropionate biosynthesis protein SbnB [Cohnella caldifontis]|uniref:2,3-diaminopropionate biosynthesis protein SbnB n=1 Tax=Cohnella caldifontis TaxID=3027471 RepID=UPI0023EC8D2D|nr:2,3-diaminopropionate biosynthesis protein SbnB [Cohnella sp. YIM B05605]